MAMYIATTVLLTVGLACGDEPTDACYNYYCTCTGGVTCLKHDPVFTTQNSYCEIIHGKTTHYTCPSHINCDEGTWFRAEKCGDKIKMKNLNGKGVLSFGKRFHPNDQGKYFCLKNKRDGCQNSRPNTLPAVVKMKGVDTYLGKFHFDGSPSACGGRRTDIMETIGFWMNETLCSTFQAEVCSFVLQHLTTQSGRYVEGYLYLADSMNISSLQILHNVREMPSPCCESDGVQLTLTNRTLQHVSSCPSERLNNDSAGTLTFPETNIGAIANSTEVCGDKKHNRLMPLASRKCEGDFISPSFWADPVVKSCTANDDNNKTVPTSHPTGRLTTVKANEASVELNENIDKSVQVTKENVNDVSRMLSKNTKNPENVDVVQLIWISERLKNITEIGSSSPEVTRHVLEIVDNLSNVKVDAYEESLPKETPTMILRALETQLTNLQKGEQNFTDVKPSLGVAACQFEQPVFGENITFGVFSSMGTEDSTELQRDVSVTTGIDNIFSKFLATLTLPANLLDGIPTGHSEKIRLTYIMHGSNFLFMNSNSWQRRLRESVESLVIAATVEGHNIANLSSPVISRFHLPHHVTEPMAKTSRKCVFWNFTLAKGLGDWSSEGCELVRSSEDNTGTIIECHCNHLTNFAVLLDVQGDIDNIALDILSIIGCMVSTFALVITVTVLLAVKKLREQVPQKIIINLSFALLGLYIFFLVGIDQHSLGTGCVIFGAFIHYFCLTSVAWMCVVATNMYLLFVRVFNVDVSGFMWKAYLAAWGVFR
ncbi:Adhesion G-protein coupled receptor G6 [Holothuria leucospilota]|uniref:Adhesion G-protein coupled receptor G6 n=1 Tax=Holothuria leucospilota TaxID=206669 RepID=A0A9Q0YQ93_HOLLE|nr:Adhesion G-protein coupled receptor G6 [Holothuria leucospilota]